MKLRDLLELARVSNLPTVWSNVWVGWLMGNLAYMLSLRGIAHDDIPLPFDDWPRLMGIGILAAIAMSLIYSGGMVMNDWVDRAVDAKERPSRPIPSGRVSATTARNVAGVLLLAGFIAIVLIDQLFFSHGTKPILSPAPLIAVLLVVMIVLYNFTHQRWGLSILLMASCRALLVLTCSSLVFVTFDWHAEIPKVYVVFWLVSVTVPCVVFSYTLFISTVARREVDPERGRLGGPKTVMNMIAAMPLLDAVWLVAMGLWPASLVCIGCAALTKLGHRRIAGS